VAHLRAVPDPDDDPVVEEVVDPAAAVAPDAADEVGSEAPAEQPSEPAGEEEPRRYPSTIGGAFYLSILAVAGTAIVIAVRSDWRLGVQMLGGALLVAALLRLLLATRDAGMLAVRNRFVDVFLLTSAGVSLLVLASSIPDRVP
jgi:hypothetical protein